MAEGGVGHTLALFLDAWHRHGPNVVVVVIIIVAIIFGRLYWLDVRLFETRALAQDSRVLLSVG